MNNRELIVGLLIQTLKAIVLTVSKPIAMMTWLAETENALCQF